ncbi:MAG: paraquat-inducible protein A [Pseudomonadales bacterium]|nr:paraquat-inducible protein A [Pseudomonadales bacterium]
MYRPPPKSIYQRSNYLACPSCDLIFDISSLKTGDTARCTGCNHFLTTHRKGELEHVAAFVSSAIIFLMIACSFPFMAFQANGLESTMTLPETAFILWDYKMYLLAFLIAAFIIVLPAVILISIMSVTIALLLKRKHPWLNTVARSIFTIKNWCMVEVFFIAVLVSLVKITRMATIEMGLSFWAYAIFSVLFVLTISRLDRFQYWRRIEMLNPHD